MDKETLDIICCPQCKNALILSEDHDITDFQIKDLFCQVCKVRYTDAYGYLDFLGDRGIVYTSKREALVRNIYAKLYTPVNNFLFLFCGGAGNARREVLSHLDLKDNALVLETGMGAGENYQWMNNKAKNLKFYGIDIQKQMMNHCIKNTRKWGLTAELFRADAIDLPFKDEVFDIVFHLGAINLFSDKKKAIQEMIRVIKPGGKIVIADETEKASKFFNFFTGANDKVIPPLDEIPASMINLVFKIIWRGFGYLISFTKPSIHR